MQKQLFNRTQLKQVKQPRVYTTECKMPFGIYKTMPLSKVAELNPDYLLWWQQQKGILFSQQLKTKITQARLNSR